MILRSLTRLDYSLLVTCASLTYLKLSDVLEQSGKEQDLRIRCYLSLTFQCLYSSGKKQYCWINALPAKDGVYNNHSSRYLLPGTEVNYENHVQIEFGKYLQTHEEHDNSMQASTKGAICLGPSGNCQGGHWFMSLTSGQRVTRYRWNIYATYYF